MDKRVGLLHKRVVFNHKRVNERQTPIYDLSHYNFKNRVKIRGQNVVFHMITFKFYQCAIYAGSSIK